MWFPEWVYTIDVIFAVGVVLFGIGGLRRGLSGELARVLALAGLLVGVILFYPQWTEGLAQEREQLPVWAVHAAVSTVMILASVLLFFFAQTVLKVFLKQWIGEVTDKLAGAAAGLLRGLVSGLLLFALLGLNETASATLSEKSAIGAWVCETITPRVGPWLQELPLIHPQPGDPKGETEP